MLTQDQAKAFAKEWVRAWNAHDVEGVLRHFAEDAEFASPFAAAMGGGGAGADGGVLRGKAALRAYWTRALERFPDLTFRLLDVMAGAQSVVVRYGSVLDLTAMEYFEFDDEGKVTRGAAHYSASAEHLTGAKAPWMYATHITPILNVSGMKESLEWFGKLGWKTCWTWPEGEAATFAAVGSGQCEIFLCLNGQGGKGKGSNTRTGGGPGEDDTVDKGVWLSVWVMNVDEVQARCVRQGLDVTHPPTDEPWGVREMHVRHPDGHVLRISRGNWLQE